MDILVVSGLLGAGKTTFLKHLVKKGAHQFAIFENEYGEIGIDGNRLRDSQSDTRPVNIWEMTEGCICCSSRAGFADSILTIANTVNPEILLVEPTGLAYLSNILKSLEKITYDRIRLLAPITLVDGQSRQAYDPAYRGLFQDQVQSAETLIVTKMDHAEAEERDHWKRRLQALNSDADLLLQPYEAMDDSWWDRLFRKRPHGRMDPLHRESGPLPDSLSLEGSELSCPEKLLCFLEDMIRGRFGEISRAKGCVKAGSDCFHFDLVDRTYSVTGGQEGKIATVFIGFSLQKSEIQKTVGGRKQSHIGTHDPEKEKEM